MSGPFVEFQAIRIGYIMVMQGLYRGNGKENGNYYLGL